MRPHKRFLLLCALAAIVFVGSVATSEAQIRRGRVARRVVVGGAYYYDPFFFADPW